MTPLEGNQDAAAVADGPAWRSVGDWPAPRGATDRVDLEIRGHGAMCGLRVNGVDAAAVEVRLEVVAGGPTVLEVVAMGRRLPMARRWAGPWGDADSRLVARSIVRACLHAQARRPEPRVWRSIGPADVAVLAVDMVLEVDSLRFAPLVPSEGR